MGASGLWKEQQQAMLTLRNTSTSLGAGSFFLGVIWAAKPKKFVQTIAKSAVPVRRGRGWLRRWVSRRTVPETLTGHPATAPQA